MKKPMKKFLVSAALLAITISGVARAADTLTVTVVSDVPSSSGTLTKAWTFSQADMVTFLAMVQARYKCSPQPCTDSLQNSALLWATEFKNRTVDIVQDYQSQQAIKAAVTPIAPQ